MNDFFMGGCLELAVITETNWHIYGVIMGVVITSLMVYDRVDSIKNRNKEDPPNHEVYQTKEEARQMEARMNRNLGSLTGKQDDLAKSFQTHTISFAKSMGHLEGVIKTLMEQHRNNPNHH